MERTTDPTTYKGTVDSGKDVRDTQMLKGSGKFTSAQNDDNETGQYETGKAPAPGKLGDRMGGK